MASHCCSRARRQLAGHQPAWIAVKNVARGCTGLGDGHGGRPINGGDGGWGQALEVQARALRGAGGVLRKAPPTPPTHRQSRQRHRRRGATHRWTACYWERGAVRGRAPGHVIPPESRLRRYQIPTAKLGAVHKLDRQSCDVRAFILFASIGVLQRPKYRALV